MELLSLCDDGSRPGAQGMGERDSILQARVLLTQNRNPISMMRLDMRSRSLHVPLGSAGLVSPTSRPELITVDNANGKHTHNAIGEDRR